jgi:phosphoenolpyruvate synthase/pyruvate phosphate dikinase
LCYSFIVQKQALFYRFPGAEKAELQEVGGKGLSLMESSRAQLPVPPGFILTVVFFEPWLDALKQSDAWQQFLSKDNEPLAQVCEKLKETARHYHFNEKQNAALEEALTKFPPDSLFAVRSSSPSEDLEGASFAGGYESVLGVTRGQVTCCSQTLLSFRA